VASKKRMLIVPAELVKKVDDNRGDMSQSEFIEYLIDDRLKEEVQEQEFVTKEENRSFQQDMKRLLKSFLDFFFSYGLEMGKDSPKSEFEELASKLQELEDDLASEDDGKEATIKWK
jgi:hypothetical protein